MSVPSVAGSFITQYLDMMSKHKTVVFTRSRTWQWALVLAENAKIWRICLENFQGEERSKKHTAKNHENNIFYKYV